MVRFDRIHTYINITINIMNINTIQFIVQYEREKTVMINTLIINYAMYSVQSVL